MTQIYTDAHRALQDEFGSTALADTIEAAALVNDLRPDQATFIESRPMFFLSSLDENGRPTVSYKGGEPGFVRVLNPQTLMFPLYDGNGMFFSAGNINANAHIGMLFIDFERPNRLRLQGRAQLVREGAEVSSYPGAQLVVRVAIDQAWVNCPRYVHKMTLEAPSPYVPNDDGNAPVAPWKRIEGMAPLLSEEDQAAVAAAGTITAERYAEMVAQGEVHG